MIVNLNVMCKVQLNELGKAIWMSQIDALPPEVQEQHPEVVSAIKNSIDEHNCLELELWKVMNIFGRYISQVDSPFKVNTLELNKNPNFGNFS